MSDIEPLAPCPFCGGAETPALEEIRALTPVRMRKYYPTYRVICTECDVCTDWYFEDWAAVQGWNRRDKGSEGGTGWGIADAHSG